MASLTGNLPIDLCYELVDWFLFEWAVVIGCFGAYSVDLFSKYFTE